MGSNAILMLQPCCDVYDEGHLQCSKASWLVMFDIFFNFLFLFIKYLSQLGTVVELINTRIVRVQYEDAQEWSLFTALLTKVRFLFLLNK